MRYRKTEKCLSHLQEASATLLPTFKLIVDIKQKCKLLFKAKEIERREEKRENGHASIHTASV